MTPIGTIDRLAPSETRSLLEKKERYQQSAHREAK